MVKRPGRTLVVGDLHGGLKAFRECLIASKYDQAKDRLIFLGNYVGAVSDSANMIECLLWLEASSVKKPVFLKGVNDKWCQMWLNSGKSSTFWLQNGGSIVVKSYIRSPFLLKTSHLDFFTRLKNFHVDNDNKAYVNAGWLDSRGLGHEPNTYNYCFIKEFWKESLKNPKKFEISKRGIPTKFRSYVYEEVFVGNSPTTENCYTIYTPETDQYKGQLATSITKPMLRRNIWNVNTGAGDGYPLTIMDVKTKQFWQSNHMCDLYPEKYLI